MVIGDCIFRSSLLKMLRFDAVKHYLSECLTQDRAPFGPRNAKDQNSWYYKIS